MGYQRPGTFIWNPEHNKTLVTNSKIISQNQTWGQDTIDGKGPHRGQKWSVPVWHRKISTVIKIIFGLKHFWQHCVIRRSVADPYRCDTDPESRLLWYDFGQIQFNTRIICSAPDPDFYYSDLNTGKCYGSGWFGSATLKRHDGRHHSTLSMYCTYLIGWPTILGRGPPPSHSVNRAAGSH